MIDSTTNPDSRIVTTALERDYFAQFAAWDTTDQFIDLFKYWIAAFNIAPVAIDDVGTADEPELCIEFGLDDYERSATLIRASDSWDILDRYFPRIWVTPSEKLIRNTDARQQDVEVNS